MTFWSMLVLGFGAGIGLALATGLVNVASAFSVGWRYSGEGPLAGRLAYAWTMVRSRWLQ